MRNELSITGLILFVLTFTTPLFSQTDVWPVQVTGSMIPPYSLDLKAYGADRAGDMNFQVMLNDPEQSSLAVKPVLTVEQNGTVLYQTDLNFVSAPIVLSQFEPYSLNGEGLSAYLSNIALTGANGNGVGSILIPEGFNQICLQMYGVERQVPVSNKFCISGNFRLNQPPQLVLPAFNEKIKMPELQNQLFSWAPMHIGSGNNPGPVEYTFELVSLPLGVMNANDAFESALKVYTTTTTATSLIYTQAEPTLEPNVYYAWRVTAKSIMYPTSKLFQNEGRSEVSMFVLYDGDIPTNDLNPLDNPSPRGCSVYETTYGSVSKSDNKSMIIAPNQNVKLGYFAMKITEASGSVDAGYSGKGMVLVPMLRSLVEVEFKNIKVNQDGRVYESEYIESKGEQYHLSSDQLRPENIANNIGGDYAKNLFNFIDEKKKVASFAEGSNLLRALPLALTNDKEPTAMVCIIGIRFSPTNAFYNLIGLENTSVTQSPNSGSINVSAATAIQATPYGLISTAHLVPIISGSSGGQSGAIPTLLVAYSQDRNSRLNCDCEGITEKKLNKAYSITSELIVQKANNWPVNLSLTDAKQPFDTYFGPVAPISEFYIPGLNKVTFTAKGGALNLSTEKKFDFPQSFNPLNPGSDSKGIWMQGVQAKLPQKYNLSNSGELVLDKGDLFIDAETIKSAKVYKNNIVDLKDGQADKWRYSVDEMSVSVNDGVFDGPSIKGQLRLPVATNLIPYSGSFDINERSTPVMVVDEKPTELDIAMWHSKMTLNDESLITADIRNINAKNTILPKANLSGNLNMNMDGKTFLNGIKGNVAELKSNIDAVFKIKEEISSFAIQGIQIQNWNLDPYNAANKKYQSGTVNTKDAKLLINGKEFRVSSASIKYEIIDGEESIRLAIASTNGNSKMEMSVWAVEKDGQFVFDHISHDKTILKCNCEEGEAYGMIDSPFQDERVLSHNGSLASVNPHSNFKNAILNSATSLLENGDFVLKNDNTLYWPLINRDIKVEKTNNRIVSKEEIEVDAMIFKSLGFKTEYNIPSNSTLYISSIKIEDWKATGAKADVILELKSSYDEEHSDRIMIFKSSELPAEGNTIKLDNVDLILAAPDDLSLWKMKNFNWKTGKEHLKTEEVSLARIDCTSGFNYFQMNGEVVMKDMVRKSDNLPTVVDFRLNTSALGNTHSLTDFIAPCMDYSNKPENKWNIHLKDLPQISYKAGDKYSVYYDNSSSKVIPDFTTSKSYSRSATDKSFKGVVFQEAACEIIGLNDGKKKALSLPVSDVVYVFDDAEGGLYSNFSAENVLDKKAGGKISGWAYGLEKVSYLVKKSAYENEVEISGEVNVPIFKRNPDNIKSVEFDSAWIEYTGNIYVSIDNGISSVNSFFEFDDIATKTYQSDFIPGLGVVLNDDSNISLSYNNTQKIWEPQGTFSGIGIVLLTSETAKAYGLTNFPDGMDLSLHCLTFQEMTLNKTTASASQSLIDETGIKSIEFGTWGVVDYSSYFKEEDKEAEASEENAPEKKDDAKETKPEVSTASGKITKSKNGEVKVTSTASGKVIRTKSGVKTVSTASGSVKRTKKTATAATSPPEKTAQADLEPEFNSLKFGVGCSGVKAVGDIYELGISVTLSVLGDNKEKVEKNKSSISTGASTKSTSTTSKGDDDKDVKTCGLNASGGVGLEFTRSSTGKWSPTGVNFKCLTLGGSIGPLEFNGGLSILRTPKDAQGNVLVNNNHGSGFKAYLSATIMGLGGIQAVGQFGKKYIDNTNSFYYGFIDLEAFKQSGFALPPPTPGNPPVIDLYGGGGGVRINMRSVNPVTELKLKKDSENAPTNDCPIPDAKYLAPGVGFSQNYAPEKGTYGGNFYLILGPWNELDNQDPPVYSIIAEPGLDIEISTDQETGDLQFRKTSVNVNAYFKPTSLAKRRDENIADAFAQVELNLQNKTIIGAFGMRMKVEAPGLQSPLIQIPEEYSSTNFNTKANYVGGKVVFSFDNRDGKKPFFNFKFGGSSVGKFTSASGLPYNTALLNVADIIKVKAGMYFQIGADVDNIPPIKELIPQVSDMESAKYDEVKEENTGNESQSKGAGISFGFKGSIEGKSEKGPLVGDFNVGLGFNVLMREMSNVTCGNLNNSVIGIKGWYAQGQAYGYANCNINLDYNLLFTSGRVNIMKAGAFVLLRANAPNPSNFSGRVNGSYSVLDGLIDGDFNMKFELGTKCENVELPSPLEGVYIFNEANIYDGQSNVDRYTDINLSTNIALQKEFNATQVDANGNPLNTETFIADIKNIEINEINKKYGTRKKVEYKTVILPNKKGVVVNFYDPLKSWTKYEIKYSFVWKKKMYVDGKYVYVENFESGKKDDKSKQPKIESGVIKFQTGVMPNKIVPGMVEYMAPGIGQRHWSAGYADTEIKFKLKALEDAVHLFPEFCDTCAASFNSPVKYKYYVQLKEFDQNGTEVSVKQYPITVYPNKANFEKVLKSKTLSVNNGQYNINVLSEENLPISKVSFPDLKNQVLTKHAMYELSVIKEPNPDPNSFKLEGTQKTNTGDQGSTLVDNDKKTAVIKSQVDKIIAKYTEVLHTSYFAVGQQSLQEKMQLLDVKYVKSKVKRRDFQHPNDAFDEQRAAAISRLGESKFHSVKDDYYAFTIKNNNIEGFDKYDMMRIKRNVQLTYDEQYVPEERIRNDRYGNVGLPAHFSKWLAGQTDVGNYMRKVLYDYTKAENEGIAQYGSSNISDGTKWHYRISGPSDRRANELQPEEISTKKVIYASDFRSNRDPNYSEPVFDNDVEYDFLLQDLRSRIVINQMAWLSKMSNPIVYSDHWMTPDLADWRKANYPAGEFLSGNKRFSNFDWVLYGDMFKNNKGNKFTYIASEPGYQFSYHGGSSISFPSDNNWGGLLESKRDKGTAMSKVAGFAPDRVVGRITETPVTNPTELVENYWYKIKVDGEFLKIGDSKQAWSALWSVGRPYSDFQYKDGQYGIYSLGGGGWSSIRMFNNVADTEDGYENIWSFVKQGSKMAAINYRYADEDKAENKNFPDVLDHSDFKWSRDNRSPRPPTTWLPSEFEAIELGGVIFSPEKWYRIGDPGKYLKDNYGSDKWRIIQEGPYYRFQSSNGFILKMHYYEEYHFFGSNEDKWFIQTDDNHFPNNKYGNPNGYFRSVWAIVPESNGSKYYFIKNIRYPSYFLALDNGNIIGRASHYGDQVIITEVKD
ncbi:MAG: hypothetical protein KBF75_08080 [Saprospiraceae bacterium]|nr:hypothetical protein [Saprospiraceae bacterium]